MPLTAAGMRLMMRQLAEIDARPIDCIRLHPSSDLAELQFELDGPEGTPFADGRFQVCLVFDEHYPQVPPKGYFRTKIFHPNVSDRGDICVNALKRDWSPQLGLRHVLVVIRCLLVEPNPESALNEEAGRLLLEDYAAYEKKARMVTGVHARRPVGAARFACAEDEEKPQTSEADEHAAPAQSADTPKIALAQDGASGSAAAEPVAVSSSPLRSLASNTSTGEVRKTEDPNARAAPAAAPADKAVKKAVDKKKAALRRI